MVHQLRTGVLGCELQIADCKWSGCGRIWRSAARCWLACSHRSPACASRRDDRSRARGRRRAADHAERRDRGARSRAAVGRRRRRSGRAPCCQADRSRAGAGRSRSLRAARAGAPTRSTASWQRVRAAVPVAGGVRRGARALGHRRDSTCARRCAQDLRIRAYLDQRFSGAPTTGRQTLIDDWMAGLRRRGDVIDLYLAGASDAGIERRTSKSAVTR